MTENKNHGVTATMVLALLLTGLQVGGVELADAQDRVLPADTLPIPVARPLQDDVQAHSAPDPAGASTVEANPGPRFDLEEAEACEAALRVASVEFERLEPIDDGGGCGTQRPLLIKEVGGVAISGNVRLRCPAAKAFQEWVEHVVVPSAQTHLDATLLKVEVSTSYQCRRRNNAATGKLSEHAFANGVDVMAFGFEDGERVPVTNRRDGADAERAFQAATRGGACAYFTTVLGPGSDAHHSGHFHLDLAERSNGYRICK